MKLFTLLTITLISLAILPKSAIAQDCPDANVVQSGSCIIVNYAHQADAIKAVTAPAETMIISESSAESNGIYIAQFNCSATAVVYTQSGACSCAGYDYAVTGVFKFTHAGLTCSYDSQGLLPVTFSYFHALAKKDHVALEWETSSEIDNEGFHIEKSSDGKNYEAFAFVDGKGNSSNQEIYGWSDRSPIAGKNYYRLKQVDFNGNERYSDIVIAEVQGTRSINIKYEFSNEELVVSSDKNIKQIEIFDITGVKLMDIKLDHRSNEKRINLASIHAGNYIVIASTENGAKTADKFVKI